MIEIKPIKDFATGNTVAFTTGNTVGSNPDIIYSCGYRYRCTVPLYVGKCRRECRKRYEQEMVGENDAEN